MNLFLGIVDAQVPAAWSILPFAVYLLMIATIPLLFGRLWHKNRNKLLLALITSTPVAIYLFTGPSHGSHWLFDSLKEYVAFIVLLTALFIISGGIYLRGSLAGTPLVNTLILGVGALLASFSGTTGASMLLIRPLLRANERRRRRVHLVVFFIFIVSNGAGMLTPLGDPPLFLGFLRGVPFLWTFRLFGPWALVNGILLALFNIVDRRIFNHEKRDRPDAPLEEVQPSKEPLRIEGWLNFLWLLGIIGINVAIGSLGKERRWSDELQKLLLVAGMAAMAGISLRTTAPHIRRANRFTWGPIVEVAIIFVGIFITMVPAIKFLEARGSALGVTQPWHFFWASGTLSSFLDNAPTYLTFASLAVGVIKQIEPNAAVRAEDLGTMVGHPLGALFLTAISCGAVFMGAITYIGNGPNFMVKAIAEEHKVDMPSFFGYMAWSIGILIPLFIIVTFIFFGP
ncbi:MAG: sodium:proton antiporter [Planctomycetes bacterium]|nr:sodium:proton antiporter [Planctomycetota bacterium]